MFLALKEIARAKARFALLVSSIALLVFLILFQQSLQNGLLTSFVGAIRNQSAPVLVYSVDGQRVIQGSVITPDLEAIVRATDDVGDVGRVYQATFSATTESGDLFDASLIGYEQTSLGAPASLVAGRFPTSPGEAVGNEADADQGFGLGDVVTLQPGGARFSIVGLAADVQLNAGPTFFVHADDYTAAVRASNPDATAVLPNILAIGPSAGIDPAVVVDRLNGQSESIDALTRGDAADETPGVASVRQSFSVIFLLYGLVVPCVTGLFFLIITFQKAGSLTLLRAIGAPARRLVASLLFQATLVIGVGYALGVLMYAPLSQQRLGSIALRFETGAVIGWFIALLALGAASSLVSARRVLAIHPVEATTGGANR